MVSSNYKYSERDNMKTYKTNRIFFKDCYVSFKEGHSPEPVDFHSHSYYEISLILSGHVKTILRTQSKDSAQSRLVLSAPDTPHLVFLSKPSHYSRLNLYFEPEFIEHCIAEWGNLSQVFGKQGNIIMLSKEKTFFFQKLLYDIMNEENVFRKKLKILSLLSHIDEIESGEKKPPITPSFVVDAITYINEHFPEKIIASDLAAKLNIGRTTLMTAIKKHTGLTLSDYVMRVRVKQAIELLKSGMSQEEAAAETGLCNGSGIIRAFRKCYGTTPCQYMRSNF